MIALDDKTICNSGCGEEKVIHIVSAFSVENDLVLGQLATEAKSNEITAFSALIELLDLKEAIVTIDAAGCQREIAAQICSKGGDYVLALKEIRAIFTQKQKIFSIKPYKLLQKKRAATIMLTRKSLEIDMKYEMFG